MDRLPLLGSILFYFFSCYSTLLHFRAGGFRPGRFDFTAIALGVLCQSYFLLQQGKLEQSCPIATLSEIVTFLSWSIGLFYIVIGPTYRISLMGAFTAPLMLGLQVIALLLPAGQGAHAMPHHPWIEAHAALSLVAFGGFGLASISGCMFLVQEQQLKSQHPSPIFHYLPPIRLLEIVTLRLLWSGWVLLTISFAAGCMTRFSLSEMKFWISFLVWGTYLVILLAYHFEGLPPHRFALSSIVIFLGALLLLPAMRYFSHLPLL